MSTTSAISPAAGVMVKVRDAGGTLLGKVTEERAAEQVRLGRGRLQGRPNRRYLVLFSPAEISRGYRAQDSFTVAGQEPSFEHIAERCEAFKGGKRG